MSELNEPAKNDVAALNNVLSEYHGASLLNLVDPANPVRAAVLPAGKSITSLKRFLDEYKIKPDRMTGTVKVETLDSLIAITNRHKTKHSALFASKKDQVLQAVFNYNHAVEHIDGAEIDADQYHTQAAEHGDHRGRFDFPISEQWKTWAEHNANPMSQAEFAAFVEDNIADVLDPADEAAKLTDEQKQYADRIGGILASPVKLLEVSRSLSVHAEETVASAYNIQSGEIQIGFSDQHKDAKGNKLKVPSLFKIAVPVYDQGAVYAIMVRLRYRKRNGALIWFYETYRADRVLEHAFKEACDHAAAETGLPLYVGTP